MGNRDAMKYRIKLYSLWGFVFICAFVLYPLTKPKGESNRKRPPKIVDEAKQSIEEASPEQRQRIQTALGDKYQVLDAAAIRSTRDKKVYYVGAKFSAEGISAPVGVWLINGDKGAPGLIYSADFIAEEFSGMRLAGDTKIGDRSSDPETKALQDYLESR